MQEKGTEVYFDAEEIIELLEHFEQMNDFKEFRQLLTLGLKLHPENSDIRIKECKCHIYDEEYEKALQLMAHIGDNDNPDLLPLKLECLYATARYDEANAFIEKHPVDTELEELYEYLAPVLSEIGKDEIACQLVKRGIVLFPENVILKEELCYHMEMEGNLHEALHLCKELIDINPYSTDYWYMQGRLLSNLGDYENAIESFDFALTCDETDIEIKLLRAYCLFMNKNYEMAIEAYMDLLSDKKDIAEHIEPILTECYMKADDFKHACALFSKLLDKSGTLPEMNAYETFTHDFFETAYNKDVTTEYLSKMFLAAKEIQDNKWSSDMPFLHTEEIHLQGDQPLLSRLSMEFIKNKYHRN